MTKFKKGDVVYCVRWNDFNSKRLKPNKQYTVGYVGVSWHGMTTELVQELFFEGMMSSGFVADHFITIDEYRIQKLNKILKNVFNRQQSI